MIDPVNAAALELQGALHSRALYPPGHPRIHEGEARALALLQQVLDDRVEVTLFAVEDRVVFEGTPLPASAALLDGLFRGLRRNGVDRITFRRGVRQSELRGILNAISADRTEADGLRESRHVTFGYLNAADAPRPIALEAPRGTAETAEASGALGAIWGDLGAGKGLDARGLEDVVSSVSRVIDESGAAMLPLAPLKRHDEYTFVHTINVAILSTAMAEAVGLDAQTTHELSIAALLHDVGKQFVAAEVLNKKGRFNDAERAEMERHPVYGARVLLSTEGVPELAPIVAFEHHIRADLSGYPCVPKGWKLSLASRLVQLADVFDALRTHRPYRPALPVDKIVEIMRGDVGPFFDADLLQIFLENVVLRSVEDSMPAVPE